ncbi:MAG: efflux RND transporter periplasmic adaptor subunit [Burkholderiales bacterium]|nr:efflux RND transporter periplasmic adaptor subunit [Burkholderiales bacterium]
MNPRTIVLIGLAGAVLAGGGGYLAKRLRTAPPPSAPVAAADPKPAAIREAPGARPVPENTVIEMAPTDLAAAETREVRRELPLTGELRPIHQAFVRAKVGGEILEMRVKEGESVKAGQVLARIDAAEFQARLDERLATLAANKATWENSERARRNNEELLRKNFISQQAYDNAVASASVAQAQVSVAEANVTLAKKALDDTVAKAPWAGLVAERAVQTGDKVAPDAKLVSLVDISRLEVEARVPAGDIPSVVVGQEVSFRVEGFGERRFTGRIARIAPQSSAGSRSLMIFVEIPNPDMTLKGGMFAKGALTLSRRQSVTAVPIAALREERGETVVYAVRDGTLARITVGVGARNEDDGWVEVTGEIRPGTAVVRTNLGTLKPGVGVRVAGAPPVPTPPAAPPPAAPSSAPPATPPAPR